MTEYIKKKLIYRDILALTDKFTKKALKSDLHLKDFYQSYIYILILTNIDNRSEKLMKIYL